MGDQAQGLRELVDDLGWMSKPASKCTQNLDKGKLWDSLKIELEFEADRCIGSKERGYRPTLEAIEAREILDRMLKMEDMQR